MPSTHWTLHTQTNTHTVSAIVSEWPNIVIGQSTTVQIWIEPGNGTLTIEDGDTYTVSSGDVEFYDDFEPQGSGELIVENGGLLILGTDADRWSEIELYTDYAGQVWTQPSQNHVPVFEEQLPPNARVSGIVMGFEPASDLGNRGVDGFWGILMNGTGTRNSVLSNHTLQLELLVLDRFSEYGSVNELKETLEA